MTGVSLWLAFCKNYHFWQSSASGAVCTKQFFVNCWYQIICKLLSNLTDTFISIIYNQLVSFCQHLCHKLQRGPLIADCIDTQANGSLYFPPNISHALSVKTFIFRTLSTIKIIIKRIKVVQIMTLMTGAPKPMIHQYWRQNTSSHHITICVVHFYGFKLLFFIH